MENDRMLYCNLTPEIYLNRLVDNRQDLGELKNFAGISICGCGQSIQVFAGIRELAFAAGKTLSVLWRNSAEFPMELNFVYRGISFYQLNSAVALNAMNNLNMTISKRYP